MTLARLRDFAFSPAVIDTDKNKGAVMRISVTHLLVPTDMTD